MTRERPILFSGPMVRAILDGHKTQTRRTLDNWDWVPVTGGFRPCATSRRYGEPGDRLWVREAFRLRADQDDKPPRDDWWKSGAWYAADPDSEPSGCAGGAGKLRPGIFMPRWASRITLEVTHVRVQRLNEISDDDAKAEGAAHRIAPGGDLHGAFAHVPGEIGYAAHFRDLWERINGKRAPWASNPWVWAITFRRVP